MKIIALTTCFNRRDITLRALESLQQQSLPPGYSMEICIVDDGSSDGTSNAIQSAFSDVTILNGNGELYWAGGMRFGWDNYVERQDMDYLLVFNDDVKLFPNAIEKLIAAALEVKISGCEDFVISGSFCEPKTNTVAYGGLRRSSRWHPLRFSKIEPTANIQECDTLNMNLALISNHALRQIGFLSSGYIHGKADYDFGLRLREKGGRVVLAAGFIGECGKNSTKGTSNEPGISFKERWDRLTSIKEQSPGQRALYYRRHSGLLWPIFWILPYLKVCLGGK